MESPVVHLEVNRQDFRQTRVVEAPSIALAPGQIRLAVERFALTTNNISYAVAGDMLDYWGFFPAESPWGRIPAIGLGSVIESANPAIDVGGRYFGFYPMATELVITAEARGAAAFRDVGEYRSNHAVTYTDFRDISADASFNPAQADEYLLLWGMFMTSFLVDDYLADNDFNGASQTLVTSASSKTSISLATCLAARPDHKAIGMTSERNRGFVESLDLYDQVIVYDEVGQLDPTCRSTVVDMAGNATVLAAVHNHFADNLTASITVGATHWEARDTPGAGGALPGPKPEFFFAPGQRAKRVGEWGAKELDERIDQAFVALVDDTPRWLTVEHHVGPAGIEATYRNLLEGRAMPNTGYVCTAAEEIRT